MKETKKQNPYLKKHMIQARVDAEDMREILTKSLYYCAGDLSSFVRMACLNYKPRKKKAKGE